MRCAQVSSPINKFAETASLVSNYTSPANKYVFYPGLKERLSPVIFAYSLSYNLTILQSYFIYRVLISRHLIFCSLTSPTCCNSPRKVRRLNIRGDKKLGFQLSHRVIHIVGTHKNHQNYTPSPLARNRTYLAWPPFMHTYFLYIQTPPPPNKFLFRFTFSSLKISKLFPFLLVSEVKFH